ncbi:MAG: penicillin-binding protein 2 [Chromatiales bacterium]|nr:penicillin-binding protein 2 [Chromatiales bacterium]
MRRVLVLGVFALGMLVLVGRAIDLQVLKQDFLRGQGDARHLRVVGMPAHRGMITDRNGEPLAISTPVDSVWANPRELSLADPRLPQLARLLELDQDDMLRRLAARETREFVYLRRHVSPELSARVQALELPGVALEREYRRYYPMGEVMAHVVGFTNIDDRGQEGLELAYDEWLAGVPGAKRVIKDRLGRVIENVEALRPPRAGKPLTLSVDRRIQYLAYRELKQAVQAEGARSGSIVVMDPRTGEVLAMANQPAFNPNTRRNLRGELYRNRGVTDVFEPGSTIKPFTIAAALEAGVYGPASQIDTGPGFVRVGGHTIRDVRNYGRIDLATVIRKSSNVGASKIALSLEPEALWSLYSQVGFGRITGAGFPGEAAGVMGDYSRWNEVERATLAFGYGLSVTPLQLAQAYSAIAADGMLYEATFLRREGAAPGRRAMRAETARQVRAMLEGVVSGEGTGLRAAIEGYRVAGKTGTARKSTVGGYAEDRYIAVFAGMAPASNPRLVVVVMINEPAREEYYGGHVAAPVFREVMTGALRLLNIPPDDLPALQARQPGRGGAA